MSRSNFKKNENRPRKFGIPQQQPMSHKPKSFQKNTKFQAKRNGISGGGFKSQTNASGRQFSRFLDR